MHAIPLDGCVVVEPMDWTKGTAAERVFENLRSNLGPDGTHPVPVDFMMVVGDGREDEKVFKWANNLGDSGVIQQVVTVSLGSRNTEAGATLTQGVSGKYLMIRRLLARRKIRANGPLQAYSWHYKGWLPCRKQLLLLRLSD